MSEMKVPMLVSKETNEKGEKPFENCQLDREKYAKILTSLVENYADGFVMALNSPWGTGKTTFLKMWQQHLEINSFATLHFNAWKTDYSSDPFVALIAQLKLLSNTKSKGVYEGVISKAATVAKRLLPAITKAAIKRYTDDEQLAEAAGVVTEVAGDSLESQIEEQLKAEKSIEDFQSALKELVEVITGGKPLVFIIDELDRCRPNYAVAVLEYIKHFFAVKGIVFVLGIDKEQLGHAVRGVYGSDKIDADEYLRRFIDLEYALPEPDLSTYCLYLHDQYGLDDFLEKEGRQNSSKLKAETKQFVDFTSAFFQNNKPSLRLIQKFYFRISVVLNFFKENNYVFPGLLVYLVYLKLTDELHFDAIKNKKLNYSELAKNYEKYINELDDNLYHEYWTEAQLLVFYRNYLNGKQRKYGNAPPLLTTEGQLNFESSISVQKWIDDGVIRAIDTIKNNFDYNEYSLGHFLDIIDLNSDIRLS